MAEKGVVLPTYQGAVHNYVKGQFDGNGLLHIGDHVGQDETATTVRGKVGDSADADVSPEQAYDLARNAGLRLLSTLHHYCDGNLDRFRWSAAHWFVILRLGLKKVFNKWRFDSCERPYVGNDKVRTAYRTVTNQ
jgi:hypothetical protein